MEGVGRLTEVGAYSVLGTPCIVGGVWAAGKNCADCTDTHTLTRMFTQREVCQAMQQRFQAGM